MQHSPEFLKIVNAARENIKEVTLEEATEILKKNPEATLVDVREESEWNQAHAKEAQHLGKGIFERDLESRFPVKNQELVLYCGGGYSLGSQRGGRQDDGIFERLFTHRWLQSDCCGRLANGP